MRYGSVCAKCGEPRTADKVKRDAQRKHGHADWCSKCYAKHSRSIRNARVSADTKRKWNIASRYGLTVAEVDAMVEMQHSKCAICAEPLPDRFHIDHCHSSGCVRGILCHGCNLKLPIVENLTLLAAAISYLERSRR